MKTFTGILLGLFLALSLQAQVKNRDKPARGEWDFRLEKVWEIENAGDDVFGQPFALTVSDDGRIYVFDPKNNINYAFDSDGELLNAFARGGQGPGEIIRQELTHIVGDTLIIPGMNGIHHFTKDGEYIKSVKQNKTQRDPRIFIDEENIISAPLTAVLLPNGKAHIVRKNLITEKESVIADFSLSQVGVASTGQQVMDVLVIGLSPIMTLGYNGGRLYWGMSDVYTIHVSDLNGESVTDFSVDRKKKSVSDRFKKDYLKHLNLPAEIVPQLAKSFPDNMTFFHRIEVQDEFVFVYVPDLDLELGRTKLKQIDIFSLEGQYVYRAVPDFGRGLNHLFSPLGNFVLKNGYAYAVCDREDDTVVIVKYRAALPAKE